MNPSLGAEIKTAGQQVRVRIPKQEHGLKEKEAYSPHRCYASEPGQNHLRDDGLDLEEQERAGEDRDGVRKRPCGENLGPGRRMRLSRLLRQIRGRFRGHVDTVPQDNPMPKLRLVRAGYKEFFKFEIWNPCITFCFTLWSIISSRSELPSARNTSGTSARRSSAANSCSQELSPIPPMAL